VVPHLFLYFYAEAETNTEISKTKMKTDTSENKMERIRYEHGQKADDYRNQKTTLIIQQNSSKLSKTKNLFPKPIKITQCNWGVGVSCFNSSI
jgi:hypothetical protein